MKFKEAIRGFLISRSLDLSPNTATMYTWALNLMCEYLDNPDVEEISERDLENFFHYLKCEYVPTRKNRSTEPLTPRSIENVWTAMRSFFKWAAKDIHLAKRPDTNIPRPQYEEARIIPFTDEEVEAILKACERTKVASTNGRKSFTMRRPTALRDLALVKVLLDTGIRASECCRINIEDVDLDSGEIQIRRHSTGRKTKARTVVIGRSTRKAVWRYLVERDNPFPEEPLFTTVNCKRMNRNTVRQLLEEIGRRAKVPNVHPHRFRHTMAIFFLRNGGDVFNLQQILGHTSLKMVQHYLALTKVDVVRAHRAASPVDRLRI